MSIPDRIPVAVSGGWSQAVGSGAATFRVEVEDPHNGRHILDLEIPEETFVLMLRNHSPHRSPLAQARFWSSLPEHYGHEHQRVSVPLVIPEGINRETFRAWAESYAPAGWALEGGGYNHHRIARTPEGDRTHLVTFSRTVPHGTDRHCAGFPDAAVHVTYYELSEYKGEEGYEG